MNPIEQLRNMNNPLFSDLVDNFLARHNLSHLKNHPDVEKAIIDIRNILYRTSHHKMFGIVMINKINVGYEVEKLSEDLKEIFYIVEQLYDIDDDEGFIQYPIIVALNQVMEKDEFNLFFKRDLELDSNIIRILRYLN